MMGEQYTYNPFADVASLSKEALLDELSMCATMIKCALLRDRTMRETSLDEGEFIYADGSRIKKKFTMDFGIKDNLSYVSLAILPRTKDLIAEGNRLGMAVAIGQIVCPQAMFAVHTGSVNAFSFGEISERLYDAGNVVRLKRLCSGPSHPSL